MDHFKRFLILLFSGAIIFSTTLAASDKLTEISGIVYEDSNGNRQFDNGEKGIPDIIVCNQHEVVKTDKKGQYNFTINEGETIIYVIKPAGYSLPLDDFNVPQFSYILNADYPLPGSIDFPLYVSNKEENFKALILADPQTRTIDEVGYLRDDIAAELLETDALFGITLGDIMFDDLSLFEPYKEVMSQIGIPMYGVPGNHDFDGLSDTLPNTMESFKQHYGPDYYAFEYGNTSFIVLNSVHWVNDPSAPGYGGYKGEISRDQLQWVENYLQYVPDDRLLVFCMHIPLHALGSTSIRGFVQNRKELFNLVNERKYLLSLGGHLHSLENFDLEESMDWTGQATFRQISCVAASGSWWSGPKDERGIPASLQTSDGTPNGYHIFSFKGNTYSQSYKAAGKDENYQISISTPSGVVLKDDLDSAIIAVNFFNGNHLSELTCQIDNAQPGVLKMTTMKDPFVETLF